MNWTAVGAVAELFGAAGVILSLIYLATQVRHSTRATRAATRQALASDLQTLASDLVTGDDIARILQAHFEGQALQPHERLRLLARAFRDFRFWDNAYFQYREGMLTDDEWRGLRENLKVLLHTEVYRDYWSREKSLFSTAFQGQVEGLLEESLEAPRGQLIFDSSGGEISDTSAD
jgi:hypothetical protein